MKHYDDLVERMRSGTKMPMVSDLLNEGAAAIMELQTDLKDCRNELCLRCGSYKTAHLGSCEGCRWTT